MIRLKMAVLAMAAVLGCGSAFAQAVEIERGVMPAEAAERNKQLTRDLKTRAYVGAVADSVSTHIGLQAAGAVEANPLVNTSPAGLIGLAVVKIGVTELVNRSSWPERDKQRFNNNASALWTGVSVNNLLIAASASTPVAIGGGVLVGYLLWKNGRELIEAAEHERIFWEEGCPAIRHYSGNPDLKCVYTPLHAHKPDAPAAQHPEHQSPASPSFEAA